MGAARRTDRCRHVPGQARRRLRRHADLCDHPSGYQERQHRSRHPRTGASKRANIGADEWINGKVDIDDTRLRATVDDIEVLSLTETKGAPVAGDIGLFVDIGSESFFSNLKITPR